MTLAVPGRMDPRTGLRVEASGSWPHPVGERVPARVLDPLKDGGHTEVERTATAVISNRAQSMIHLGYLLGTILLHVLVEIRVGILTGLFNGGIKVEALLRVHVLVAHIASGICMQKESCWASYSRQLRSWLLQSQSF